MNISDDNQDGLYKGVTISINLLASYYEFNTCRCYNLIEGDSMTFSPYGLVCQHVVTVNSYTCMNSELLSILCTLFYLATLLL